MESCLPPKARDWLRHAGARVEDHGDLDGCCRCYAEATSFLGVMKLRDTSRPSDADRLDHFVHLRRGGGNEGRAVASQGWALDLEECAQGLCCLAAPVHDASGAVVAAISVSAPIFRVSEARIHDEVMPGVLAASAELSARMGFAAAAA